MTLRDQMSDSRPYSSWPTVDVLHWVSAKGSKLLEVVVHKVAVCDPGDLRGGTQGISDDVQAGRERSLVNEGQEIGTRAGKKYLISSVLF